MFNLISKKIGDLEKLIYFPEPTKFEFDLKNIKEDKCLLVVKYDNYILFNKVVSKNYSTLEVNVEIIANYKKYVLKNLRKKYKKSIIPTIKFSNEVIPYNLTKINNKLVLFLGNYILFSKNLYISTMDMLDSYVNYYQKTYKLSKFLVNLGIDFEISSSILQPYDVNRKIISINFDLNNRDLKTKFINDVSFYSVLNSKYLS